MFIITTKRVMIIDVQGMSGKKIEFKSIPFKFIKGFSVESAGTLSRTVKATLFCSKMAGGMGTDFGKKDTNIFEINNSIANRILNLMRHCGLKSARFGPTPAQKYPDVGAFCSPR